MGYHRAGFDVVGVDINPQPKYPFTFIQADVMEWLQWPQNLRMVAPDAIHASPPCQAYSALNNGVWGNASGHPALIEPTRELLIETGLPYVIENVPRSPLRDPVMLCGSMFGLHSERGYLRRHRLFESNVSLTAPTPCNHTGQTIGVYGHGQGGGPMRGRSAGASEARELLGIDWMTRDGMSQAIPPAYTQHLGNQLLKEIQK